MAEGVYLYVFLKEGGREEKEETEKRLVMDGCLSPRETDGWMDGSPVSSLPSFSSPGGGHDSPCF